MWPKPDRSPPTVSVGKRKRLRRDLLRRLAAQHGPTWPSSVHLPVYWFHGALVDGTGSILAGKLNPGAPNPPVLPWKQPKALRQLEPRHPVGPPKLRSLPGGRGLPWGNEQQGARVDWRGWTEP